ncbi:hypothetical protein TSUD_395140, partial [Trifolium subterraneum]
GFQKCGDRSCLSDISSDDLRKTAMDYHIKGAMLSYFLSARQELEVIEAKNKMKVVDEHLGSLEKEYAATKTKHEEDIKGLKVSHDEEVKKAVEVKENEWAKERKVHVGEVKALREEVKTQLEQLASEIKETDNAVSQRDELIKERDALTSKVNGLQVDLGYQYDEGFQFALEQLKITLSEIDAAKLGELDALNKIVDGKIVPFTLPGAT